MTRLKIIWFEISDTITLKSNKIGKQKRYFVIRKKFLAGSGLAISCHASSRRMGLATLPIQLSHQTATNKLSQMPNYLLGRIKIVSFSYALPPKSHLFSVKSIQNFFISNWCTTLVCICLKKKLGTIFQKFAPISKLCVVGNPINGFDHLIFKKNKVHLPNIF